MSFDWSGSNAENFTLWDHHSNQRAYLYGRKYTTGTTLNGLAGWHFYGNGTTLALRIDGSANVGVGTTSPKTLMHIGKGSTNSTTNETIPSSNMGVSADFPGSTNLWLAKHSSAQAEDYWGMALGTLYAGGNSYIQTLDKSNSSYYNLLLQPNGGNVGIAKASPSHILDVKSDSSIHIEQVADALYETKIHGGALFIRNPSTSSGYEHMIINNHTTGSHQTNYIQFRRGNTGNGTAIGSIVGNGSTISYGTGSDYRLKENVVPMQISGLDTINNLRPKRFNFIGHSDDIYDGFLAHELQEHIPSAVSGVKDEMRGRGNVVKVDDESIIVKQDVSEPDSLEEGTKWVKLSEVPVYQNVDLSKVVTYLVKAIQEVDTQFQAEKTKTATLETQVAALLARVTALENA